MKKAILKCLEFFASLILLFFFSFTEASGQTPFIFPAETFADSADFSSDTTTAKFYSPGSCTKGGLQYYSSGGCTDGNIGFSGAWNNSFTCFLRTPAANCTGKTAVTLNFDISNSFIAAHQSPALELNDRIRFYMYVDGKYKKASSIKINGAETGENDINGIWLKFNAARTCVNADVTFDLTNCTDLSNILFYLEPVCAYHDANIFSVGIDNVSLK